MHRRILTRRIAVNHFHVFQPVFHQFSPGDRGAVVFPAALGIRQVYQAISTKFRMEKYIKEATLAGKIHGRNVSNRFPYLAGGIDPP